MLLQVNSTCLINFDNVIKIEAGNSTAEGQFVIIYHTLNADLKWTKVFFQKDEEARNAFIDKITTAYANGDKICK